MPHRTRSTRDARRSTRDARRSTRDARRSTRDARYLWLTWLLLMLMTAGSFQAGAAGGATAALVIGIAALKAHLVAGVFMELLRAPRVYAVAMAAFLLAQAAAIVAFFV